MVKFCDINTQEKISKSKSRTQRKASVKYYNYIQVIMFEEKRIQRAHSTSILFLFLKEIAFEASRIRVVD